MTGIFDLGAKCHVQGGDRIFDDIAEYMEARIEEPEYMETDENLNRNDHEGPQVGIATLPVQFDR